jgi:hypothetical protein
MNIASSSPYHSSQRSVLKDGRVGRLSDPEMEEDRASGSEERASGSEEHAARSFNFQGVTTKIRSQVRGRMNGGNRLPGGVARGDDR